MIKKLSHSNIIKLLEHKKENFYDIICNNLDLQIYVDDCLTSICGNLFVLDIKETKEHTQKPLDEQTSNQQIISKKKVMLTFVGNKLNESFRYATSYFEICLNKKDIKTFYLLLKFFASFDKNSNAHQKIHKFYSRKMCVDVNSSFLHCQCLVEGKHFCNLSTYDNIARMGSSYNVFTHKYEKLLVIDEHIFHFPIKNEKIVFFNKMVFNDDRNEKELIEILSKYIYFYKIASNFITEVKFLDGNEKIELVYKYKKYIIDKVMNVWLWKDNNWLRLSEMSFMLKRGVSIADAVNYLKN